MDFVMHPKIDLGILAASEPKYATYLASGFDLLSPVKTVVKSGERKLIETGIHVAVPVGYELQIRSKSGLALKNGIVVLNSPGTIDADFRGKIGVILMNHSKEDFYISEGMKIAQGVLCPVVQARFVLCEDLDDTARGSGGFGSTGVF